MQLDYFTNTAFSVNFVVFFLFTAALIALAGFTSVFISKAKSSRTLHCVRPQPQPLLLRLRFLPLVLHNPSFSFANPTFPSPPSRFLT